MDIASMFSGEVPAEELMNRWHLAALFSNKVFYACREAGVTPLNATGDEFSLNGLLDEAQDELGLGYTEQSLSAMSRWRRAEAEFLVRERRAFAYSVFLRLTSGGIAPQSKPPVTE